jgi:hypothetical protein
VTLGVDSLQDNSTASAAIDSACSKLLRNNTSECEKVADVIAVKVIDLLEEDVQPSAVCTELGYC